MNLDLVIFDCDGVLTDGRLYYAEGIESKAFDIKDGMGIRLLREAGIQTAVLTARGGAATERRVAELKFDHYLDRCDGKAAGLKQLLEQAGVEGEQAAYMGDDWLDLPAMAGVGYTLAPADASPAVLDRVDWIAQAPGGRGAVREACEHLLKAVGKFDQALARYTG